jgi:hypothetical protein
MQDPNRTGLMGHYEREQTLAGDQTVPYNKKGQQTGTSHVRTGALGTTWVETKMTKPKGQKKPRGCFSFS